MRTNGGVEFPGDAVSLMEVAERHFVSEDPEELLEELAGKYQQGGLQYGHGTRRYFNLPAIQRRLAIQLFLGLRKVERVQSLRFRYLSHETNISFLSAVNDKIPQVREGTVHVEPPVVVLRVCW